MSSYNASTPATDLTHSETSALIAASKVNGTSVYNANGESLGSIYDLMLDKRSGHVTYAVLSFGGILGMGAKYHPLPWNQLTYDERLGGYVVNLDKSTLEGAPAYESDGVALWNQPSYTNDIDSYYAPHAPVI